MFVFSIKKKQVKLGLIVVIIAIMVVVLAFLSKGSISASGTASVNVKASTAQERIAYLSQFGWNVKEDPLEVTEVIIPAEFDDVYTKYNEIQKLQGFDLTLYASKRVKRWTYEVTNYTGYENANCIRVNMLVSDGKVIGGDVCSVKLDGFMHGFAMPQV
ncbi:MAG: DUF4830 domain-containing protein [Oscillospiraceae bacterium]